MSTLATRIKIRQDLTYWPDPQDEDYYLIKDEIRGEYFRYNELQVAMMRLLDGRRSFEDLQELLFESFDCEVPIEAIRRFVDRLRKNHLLDVVSYVVDNEKTRKAILRHLRKRNLIFRVSLRETPSREGILFHEGAKMLGEGGDPCKAAEYFAAVLEINPQNERAREVFQGIHLAYFKARIVAPENFKMVHLFNPDRMLAALDGAIGRFLFSPPGVLALAAIILFAIWPAISVVTSPGLLAGFDTVDFILIIIYIEFGGIFHELCHGLACKHYGGRVTDIGLLIAYGLPGAYCDTGDTYLFARSRDKIVVQLAGTVGHLLWQATGWYLLELTDPSFPMWNAIAFANIYLLVPTIQNLIPLVKFDGYYALAEYLGIYNLRERSLAYIRNGLQTSLLGVPAESPPMTKRERRIFLLFGIAASAFSVFWIYGIWISIILPFAVKTLGILGGILGVIYFLDLLGLKLMRYAYTFVCFLVRERRVIATLRRAIGGAVVVAATAAILYIPWPLHVEGEMLVEPRERVVVRAEEAGLLVKVLVNEGQSVQAGQPLAVLRSDELVRDEEVTRNELAIVTSQLAMLRQGARPEDLALSTAKTISKRVQNAAANERLKVASKLRQLDVDSLQNLQLARRLARRSGGDLNVALEEQNLVVAGTRPEVIAEMDADVRRWANRLEELKLRREHLEIKAEITGIVVGYHLQDRIGEKLEVGDTLLEVHETSKLKR